MTVWSSGGDRYQVNVLGLTDLDMDVEILLDDILDDDIADDVILDDEIIEDVKTVEPVTPSQGENNTPAPGRDLVAELANLFKKAPEAEYYTLGNDKITSIVKVVGQRNGVTAMALPSSIRVKATLSCSISSVIP